MDELVDMMDKTDPFLNSDKETELLIYSQSISIHDLKDTLHMKNNCLRYHRYLKHIAFDTMGEEGEIIYNLLCDYMMTSKSEKIILACKCKTIDSLIVACLMP